MPNTPYKCNNCNYVHLPANHNDIDFVSHTDDWKCPDCQAGRDQFSALLSEKIELLNLQISALPQINIGILKQAYSVQHPMVEIATPMATWSKMFQTNHNAPVLEAMTKTAELYKNTIAAAITPITESLMENLKKLPDHVRQALITYGEHGWYYDWEMPFPDIWDWESAFIEGRIEEAEGALSGYFESRIDEIEAYIINKLNHRKDVISEAFAAHRAGKYALSIPVIFAQTDGICKDIFDRCLFKRDNKTFNAIAAGQITNDTILSAILSPLDEKLPVIKHRHMVMHGIELDYGTRINSLKAISLINYVASVTEDE